MSRVYDYLRKKLLNSIDFGIKVHSVSFLNEEDESMLNVFTGMLPLTLCSDLTRLADGYVTILKQFWVDGQQEIVTGFTALPGFKFHGKILTEWSQPMGMLATSAQQYETLKIWDIEREACVQVSSLFLQGSLIASGSTGWTQFI